MSTEKLLRLEYRDDTKINRLKPTSKIIKEIPYMQNNPVKQQGFPMMGKEEE
jgi:hypothetical protein